MSADLRWQEIAPTLDTINVAGKVWKLRLIFGKVYACTEVDAKLLRFDNESAWSVLTARNDIGGSGQIVALDYAPNFNKIVGSGGARIGQYSIGNLDWDSVVSGHGFRGDVIERFISGTWYYISGNPSVSNRRVYRWDGAFSSTTVSAELGGTEQITFQIEYNGEMYLGTNEGRLYQWDSTGNSSTPLIQKAGSTSSVCRCLLVFKGALYAIHDDGKLRVWNDVSAWVEKAGVYNGETDLRQLVEFNGALYVCTQSSWVLYWDEVSAWKPIVEFTEPTLEISTMLDYNGRLLGGGEGSSALYELKVIPRIADFSRNVYEKQGDILMGL